MLSSINTARSENANILAVIHPSPQLCTRCASIPWPSRPSDNESVYEDLPFHETFHALQESADRGCALCRFAWLSAVNDSTLTNDVLKSLTKETIKLRIGIRNDLLVLSCKFQHDGRTPLYHSATRFEIIESGEMELLGSMKRRHIKTFAEENIQQELRELIQRQIQPWIENCRKQHADHERCGMKTHSSILPTRLVDVGEIDQPLVKLVEVKSCTDIQDFTYLILSYCWGNGNVNSTTTVDNLEMRLRGFTVSGLPKTIRDAIYLTRMMGFRYLWVDAICIIQGLSGDFHSESPKMGDYYSNAACCISASAANDSSEGFLTERPFARFPIDNIAIRIARHPTDKPGYFIFQTIDNNPNMKDSLLDSPLTERGWCLQETALPPRILHWTAQGLYLQCKSSLFLEDLKVPWKGISVFERPTPRAILAMPNDDILFSHGWYRLVSIFSETQLTYETDRLYAIHGLASLLIQRLRVEYFNGLFRTSLAEGLLWYHRFSHHGTCKRPENAKLPSWCWASNCPVDYQEIYQTPIFIRDDHPGRPLQFPTHPGDTSIVESPASRLYIRAPIIQLMIGRNRPGYTAGYTKDKTSVHKVSFESWLHLDRQRKVMKSMTQTLDRNVEWWQGVSILWVPVGRIVNAYSRVVGLLVHELSDEGRGVYCRYGILECHNMVDKDLLRDFREIVLT